jgi:hypothetical protein
MALAEPLTSEEVTAVCRDAFAILGKLPRRMPRDFDANTALRIGEAIGVLSVAIRQLDEQRRRAAA